MLPAPWLLAIGLVVGLLVLIPSRRLESAGFRARTVAAYAIALWALAMRVAIRPGPTRSLIPILVVAYLAPFVGAPEPVRRIFARGRVGAGGRRAPMKDVTPRDDDLGGVEDDAMDPPAGRP